MHNNNHFSIKVLRAAEQLKLHIDQHMPQEWINAETFARKIKVKREKLQQCFYLQYGKKIREYQQEKKIEIACLKLTEGEIIIKEISFQCGYSNQTYFSNVFKKQKKMTPTEWQRKNGNEDDGS